MLLRACIIVFALGVLLSPLSADAQRRRGRERGGPSNAAAAASREQFERGLEAAGAERWEDALDAFSQAYDLAPSPSTLLNIAGAQAQLGRVHEAIESYESYLGTRPASEIARHRRDAEQALEATRARVARVRIRLRGLLPTDRVELDAMPVLPADLEAEQALDPRAHLLVVRRGNVEAFRREFTLADGARQAFDWEVTVVSATDPLVTTDDPGPLDAQGTPPSQPITKSPWFWVGIGVGAAAVVTAVVVAVVLTTGSDAGSSEPGYVGNANPGSIQF